MGKIKLIKLGSTELKKLSDHEFRTFTVLIETEKRFWTVKEFTASAVMISRVLPLKKKLRRGLEFDDTELGLINQIYPMLLPLIHQQIPLNIILFKNSYHEVVSCLLEDPLYLKTRWLDFALPYLYEELKSRSTRAKDTVERYFVNTLLEAYDLRKVYIPVQGLIEGKKIWFPNKNVRARHVKSLNLDLDKVKSIDGDEHPINKEVHQRWKAMINNWIHLNRTEQMVLQPSDLLKIYSLRVDHS